MTARLAGDDVAMEAEGARKVRTREIARQPHEGAILRRDDFIADEVQPDHFRTVPLVEMAAHGVANRGPEGIEVIGFRHN